MRPMVPEGGDGRHPTHIPECNGELCHVPAACLPLVGTHPCVAPVLTSSGRRPRQRTCKGCVGFQGPIAAWSALQEGAARMKWGWQGVILGGFESKSFIESGEKKTQGLAQGQRRHPLTAAGPG